MGFAMRRVVLVVLVGIFSFHGFCICEQAPRYAFMKNATEVPPVSYYDYIVLGGGTAGCPLAATLSKNFKVLLLERGGSPYDNPKISNLVDVADNLFDTSPDSPSQLFFSEDGVPNARARVLGGGTCLNFGFYSRAPHSYVRDAGWDAALVNRSYQWVEERAVVHEPRVLQWQSALRAALLEAGVAPYNGFTFDHVAGTKVGGTTFDRDGRRRTAADLLDQADPASLTVLLWATVQRVLFGEGTGGSGGKARPVARGVVFQDKAGAVHRAYLKLGGEVILSAGALGSPQLLMLSGVGPAEKLGALGARVALEQPMVGQGMADNPMNGVLVPSPKPVEISLVQVVGITPYGSYIEAISGINFAAALTGSAGPQLKTATSVFGMSASQRVQPATEATRGVLHRATIPGGFILEKVMGPLSKGHLELTSLDPGDDPRVTFNYFQQPEDLRRCVEGLRTIERVVQSRAFAQFRYTNISMTALLNMTAGLPLNVLPRHDNVSTSLEQYCRDTVSTMYHYHGGCQVGRVVDRDYRVIGIDALRVVDGSTFDYTPGTNPQATIMMLGRYMGIKIQEERLGTTVK